MGKGTRNRDLRTQDKIEHPELYKEKKHAPKWLAPAISILIAAAILFGVAFNVCQSNGVFERARVLVKSETGRFNVTQPMATFLAWENMYYEAYYYYYYLQYGIYQDSNGILDSYSSAEDFAINQAYASTKSSLRDSVENMKSDLIKYVAICDAAYKAGVSLTDEEKEDAASTFDWLESIQETVETQYGFSGSATDFYDEFISQGLKKSDIKKVNNLIALYNKYYTMQKFSYESISDSEVKTYVTENPSSFFSTDYLTYATDDEDFSNLLKTATDKTDFSTKILDYLFEKNLQSVYNGNTVKKELTDELASVSGKTNENEGTALNDAIAAIGLTVNDYSADDLTEQKLKDWFFDASRKQGDTTILETESGYYQAAFVSSADSKVTGAYELTPYEVVEDAVKTELQKQLLSDLVTKPETAYKAEGYKTANDKANELKTALAAEGANRDEILAGYTVLTDTVNGDTKEGDLPDAIYKYLTTAENLTVGDSIQDGDGVSYFLTVESIVETDDDTEIAITHVRFDNDLYYDVFEDLTDLISKELPETATYSMPANLPADGYEAWLMAHTSDAATGLFKSDRAENDTTVFSVTDSKTEKTTYNVYMVINKPLYMTETATVYGGYITFTGSEEKTADEQANEALAKMNGKTGYDLLAAMNLVGATASTSLDESSISDETLKTWFFSADRKANDVAKLTSEDGNSVSVVGFFSANESWYRTAKDTMISTRMTDWTNGLTANYTVNEKNLEKLGELSTTAETEAA